MGCPVSIPLRPGDRVHSTHDDGPIHIGDEGIVYKDDRYCDAIGSTLWVDFFGIQRVLFYECRLKRSYDENIWFHIWEAP